MAARDALVIGGWQTLALLPGLSRSGLTIAGGVNRDLPFAEAAPCSFLLLRP
ncbi:putative Undecaprenyl-diphosphate phosphatase [Candidatus Hydrogenisulfobacillus filiaventi]|uniref:Undecaprenyl-diphosphatase n=1 Tax=Candidatus Hydrogenisulfobacillus filiaventi TaxID=2707344 RepID=A0A6F8ZFA7_9FIRM|nr:hypothetical protein [Bacillota bacterium]CAB1128279.1 putative Undecaprenyl-diphosphate phosphatase [Candidatus Hydrogenisulfobacillus filiaventi]